jgi:hypothetical protein
MKEMGYQPAYLMTVFLVVEKALIAPVGSGILLLVTLPWARL